MRLLALDEAAQGKPDRLPVGLEPIFKRILGSTVIDSALMPTRFEVRMEGWRGWGEQKQKIIVDDGWRSLCNSRSIWAFSLVGHSRRRPCRGDLITAHAGTCLHGTNGLWYQLFHRIFDQSSLSLRQVLVPSATLPCGMGLEAIEQLLLGRSTDRSKTAIELPPTVPDVSGSASIAAADAGSLHAPPLGPAFPLSTSGRRSLATQSHAPSRLLAKIEGAKSLQVRPQGDEWL